jgi:hypothetical protein
MYSILAAPCGIHCGICLLFRAVQDARLRERISEKLHIPLEKCTCPGCRAISGFCPVIHKQCATWICAKEKGVTFCSECAEFPCRKLMPYADRAAELPQNIKIFSLSLRKARGNDAWEKSIHDIYGLYFFGEMVIGGGPKSRK